VSNTAQLLSLNCFILGDQLNQTFTVEVPKTKNISILKDLIKEKKAPDLDHVSASKLILSEAPQPDGSLNTADRTPLDPLLPLSKLFPRVEENRLHIIVQAPPKGDPISVVSDNITDFLQSPRRTRKTRRGEMGLLL
jgi:hypothetical protein